MAINPTSDIVLDVARAADPDRSAAVARRLTSLAGGAPSADFASALDQASAPTPSAAAPVANAFDMRARLANAAMAQVDKANQAPTQFEAVLLNSFVNEMLPKDTPSAFGEGLAGDMWRSMLADQVSRKIASSGTLGIGQRLFATHPLNASSSMARGAHDAEAAAQMSANALSAASGADLADGSFLFKGAKPI